MLACRVRDGDAADGGALESTLVDQAPGAEAGNLLVNRAYAWLAFQRRVAPRAPLQIGCHDGPHAGLVPAAS